MSENRRKIRPSMQRCRSVLSAAVVGLALLSAPAAATTGEPGWSPKASERLVKLPATYLKKTLDRDFAESELGQAIRRIEEEVRLKSQTLVDLQAAIDESVGEVHTELRHQFLIEKRAFLEQMTQRNRLKRRHLETQGSLLEKMLGRMTREQGALTPVRRDLVERQNGARERFESSLANVDMKIFGSTAAPESKYTQRYAENMAAIEQLITRIQSHPMSEAGQTDGGSVTKQQYLRQMLAESQAGVAILDQDETILGYMAKLIALDALALSEEALDAELADSDILPVSGPADAVDFFVTN